MIKKKRPNLLEDGSAASTGHKPKKKASPDCKLTGATPHYNAVERSDNGVRRSREPVEPIRVINVGSDLKKQIEADRTVESYAYKIRQEVKLLSKLTDEISTAYSQYAESNERIDSSLSIHNGLGNMMKLIEVQTTTKLRIKKMQTAIMQTIAQSTPDDELPYAVQDIMREINVNFLDSKLVRAYGEIARIMKEDLELAKVQNNEIQFAPSELSSELEAMQTIDVTELAERFNVEENESESEDYDEGG